MKHLREEILEKAEKMNVKVSGLDDIPYIVQGRPLFDFTGVDKSVLDEYGHSENDLWASHGLHNIAIFPDGRVESLKTVSKQYKLVQHLEAINLSMDFVPEEFQLETVNVSSSYDGGRIWAKFMSKRKTEIKKGDMVQLQATLQNSCDTTKVYRMISQAYRLVCSNGMVAPDTRFDSNKIRKLHKGGLHLETQVKEFFGDVESSISAIDHWKKYTEKEIKVPELESVFQELELGPRIQEEILNTSLRGENTTIQLLLDERRLSAWDLYNSFSQRITDSNSSESVKIEQGEKISRFFDELIAA